jgi:putative hydrolase of the HAD superfamily
MRDVVLFDLGGVVFDGPMGRFADYERSAGLPPGLIRQLNATNPDDNAWARLERGELTVPEFVRQFEAAAADAGFEVDARRVLDALRGEIFPEMVRVLGRLRAAGLTLAAVTNNIEPLAASRPDLGTVLELFDSVVESSVEGVRKPEPAFYELALDRLCVSPDRCVYLDDLGVNLKPARAMGMVTIKVVNRYDAIAELERCTGVPLMSELRASPAVRPAQLPE